MDRRRDDWVLNALGAVILVALIVMAGALVVGLTTEKTDEPALKVVPTETFKRVIVPTARPESIFSAAHPKPTVLPTSWSVGIVENGEAPIAGMAFGGRNHWSWDLDGNHVVVYAGRDGSETRHAGRGVLIVLVTAMDLSAIPELNGSYEAPPGVGPLRIASYEGAVLTVVAETGETFYFNAKTRDFTDANGDPIATDTPTPRPTKPTYSLPSPLPEGATATPPPPG